jgi:DeoR/GlpR family transcriptional regulator of sugar metabolism
MDRLLKEERQQRILEVLQEFKRVTVPELSQRFGISEVTIRRDLHELAQNGRLHRAHRGAIEVSPAPPEAPVIQRMALEQEMKERLARAAASLVQDGDALFIGSGSTTMLFSRMLLGLKRLVVITNAINIAAELAAADSDWTIVLAGGVLRKSELSLLGHITEQTLQEVRVDRIIMGVQALSVEDGWTTDHMPEVQTTRRIVSMASNLVILADASKLGRKAAAFIAPLTRVTTLITNREADAHFVTRAKALGVQVIQA